MKIASLSFRKAARAGCRLAAIIATVALGALALLGAQKPVRATDYTGELYTTFNWRGFIYKVQRDPTNYHWRVTRMVAPTAAGLMQSPAWQTPPVGDFSNTTDSVYKNGELFYYGPAGNAGWLSTGYPAAAAPPLMVRTGPYDDNITDSMTLLWIRWIDGVPGAVNKAAWAALTINQYKNQDEPGVTFSTCEVETSASSLDVTAIYPIWSMYNAVPQVGAAAIPGGQAVLTAHPSPNRDKIMLSWWNLNANNTLWGYGF